MFSFFIILVFDQFEVFLRIRHVFVVNNVVALCVCDECVAMYRRRKQHRPLWTLTSQVTLSTLCGIGGRIARNYCHHNVRRDAWRCYRRAVSWRPRRNFTDTRLKLTFLRRKIKNGHNRKYLLSPPT